MDIVGTKMSNLFSAERKDIYSFFMQKETHLWGIDH